MRIYYLCAKTKQQYLLVSIKTNGTSAKRVHTREGISEKIGGMLRLIKNIRHMDS